MNIVDYIPIGHKNAISRARLTQEMARKGISERKVRDMIAEANKSDDDSVLIINLQDGKGYFRPAPDENNYVRIWKMMHGSRTKECKANMDAADRYLTRDKKKKQVEDPSLHQMSIFDLGVS